MLFLTNQPLWLSGLLLVGLPTLLAMVGLALVRRRFGLDSLRTNNEVAGFKFATVGVLYAVLLAFAVVVVWEKFSNAEKDVSQEAGAVATIYRLADGIGGESGAALRDGLTGYVKAAIADDWPAMGQGKASPVATQALTVVYVALLPFTPSNRREAVLLGEVLRQLDQVTQARRARLVAASGAVPEILWLVLITGAVLTTGFTLFFGTANLRAQAMMSGALSVLVFSGLFVIVAIDHPFTGPVKVQPEALAAVLEDFGEATRP